MARGGWPEIKQMERARVGARHPEVPALRERLMVSGDLDANAGGLDIYDSYVEAGVSRLPGPARLACGRHREGSDDQGH